MQKRFFVVAALVVLTTGFAQYRDTLAQTSDEAEIRRVIAAYAEARQTGDGPAQASLFGETADEWRSSTRKMVTGRSEIAKDLVVPPSPNRKFSLRVDKLQLLSQEIALVDAEAFGTRLTPNARAIYILRKHGDRWLIQSARVFRYPDAE